MLRNRLLPFLALAVLMIAADSRQQAMAWEHFCGGLLEIEPVMGGNLARCVVDVSPTQGAPPTNTPIPVDTPEPTQQPGELCEHNPDAYHGLEGEGPLQGATRCHFNHTHGMNPAALDHIFGPLPDYILGVSGPHATDHENELKHEGYKWFTFEEEACTSGTRKPDVSKRDSCILAYRVMLHALGGPADAVVRFHSVFVQVYVCSDSTGDCGIVTAGHHADFGILAIPYKGQHVPLPGDPPGPHDVHAPGYRGHAPITGCPNPSGGCNYTWLSNNARWFSGLPVIQQVGVKNFDDWQGIDPADPFRVEFSGIPGHNHSAFQFFALWVNVPAFLDADGDGLVTYDGYTDRLGRVVFGCSEVGPDCLPVSFVGAPVGLAQFSRVVAPTAAGPGTIIEMDTAPEGEEWIKWPN